MKTGIKILVFAWFAIYCNCRIYAQSGAVATGGDISGANGEVNYSIGQVDYITIYGGNDTALTGVQIPYEIYILKGKEIPYVNLSVFPNPSAGFFTLYVDETVTDWHGMSYIIYDRIGQIIMNETINNAKTGITLNEDASGMYILKVFKESEEIKEFKIISFTKK